MGLVDNARKFFNITTKKVPNDTERLPYPADRNSSDNGRSLTALKMPDEIDRLYKLWLSDALDSNTTLKNRIDRVKELSYAYYNSPLISNAVRLYADETLQADAQKQIIQIYAKNPKFEVYINEFFEKIGVTDHVLKAISFDLALFADHFWVLTTKEGEGITRVTPIDIRTVKDRIEFNAIRVMEYEERYRLNNMLLRIPKLALLKDLIDKSNDTDYSQYFESYLFGYQLMNEIMLPPWNILHFRIMSYSSEFYPYGRPILINCLSPFKQLQTAMNLMSIARANNFPLKKFEVAVDNQMTAMDQWQVVATSREQYENLLGISNREQFSAKSELWVPKELVDITVVDTSTDMNQIADVEMLKANLADATGIPADYLFSSVSSWGKSGQSLLQQSKVFARSVFTIQTAIIDELVNLVKLQLALTEDFPMDEEFEISLPFPVQEDDADKLRQKGDSISLAKDILDGLAEVMGIEPPMPVEIVKDILNKLSFLTADEINEYLKIVEKHKAELDKQAEEAEAEESSQDEFGNDDDSFEEKKKIRKNVEKKVLEKISKRYSDTLLREVYFNTKKKKSLSEGILNGRHYQASFKNTDIQKSAIYEVLLNKTTNNRLDEEIINED